MPAAAPMRTLEVLREIEELLGANYRATHAEIAERTRELPNVESKRPSNEKSSA